MRDHSEQVERPRVFRIGLADTPVKALSLGQTTGAMMSHRSCERLFGTAPGIHGDISKGMAAGLVAPPIASETQIHLAGGSVDPDRLIAGQRARRPRRRIACNVRGGMHHEPAAAIWRRWNNVIPNDIGAGMMASGFVGVGQSAAGAEHET